MVKGINLKEGQFVIYLGTPMEVIMNNFFGELVLDNPSGQEIIEGEKNYTLCSSKEYEEKYANHGETTG